MRCLLSKETSALSCAAPFFESIGQYDQAQVALVVLLSFSGIFDRNFRFGPLARALRTLPFPRLNEFGTRAGPIETR
jgi:hypothetical protein